MPRKNKPQTEFKEFRDWTPIYISEHGMVNGYHINGVDYHPSEVMRRDNLNKQKFDEHDVTQLAYELLHNINYNSQLSDSQLLYLAKRYVRSNPENTLNIDTEVFQDSKKYIRKQFEKYASNVTHEQFMRLKREDTLRKDLHNDYRTLSHVRYTLNNRLDEVPKESSKGPLRGLSKENPNDNTSEDGKDGGKKHILTAVGKEISKARNRKELSQEELAKMCAMPVQLLRSYEKGEGNIENVYMERLSSKLEVRLGERHFT